MSADPAVPSPRPRSSCRGGATVSRRAPIPRRPWRVFDDGASIVAILDASDREIIGWAGFDSSKVRGHIHRVLMAQHIVDCVNAEERNHRRPTDQGD